MQTATGGPWYWCLTHARVEGQDGCANIDRLGPYDTREEAAAALTRAKERTEAWDAQDASWRGGSGDGGKPASPPAPPG
jgi:hypothetical protein